MVMLQVLSAASGSYGKLSSVGCNGKRCSGVGGGSRGRGGCKGGSCVVVNGG